MSSDSDSEDDIPLSQLKKTLTPKKRTPAKKVKKEVVKMEADSSSSDDEMSLADMKKKLKKEATKSKKKKPASAKKKKKKPAASSKKRSRSKSTKAGAKKRKTAKSPAKSSSTAKSVATGILGTTDINTYKDSNGARKAITCKSMTKQQLVTAVLCRWWYAFDWPTTENLEEARKEFEGKQSYRELGGMPGVFICILGEHTGKLIDKRDLNRGFVPSVASMMKRSSGELIDLWIKALKGQIQALKESKSEENPKLLKALQTELKTAESSNREKIENACKRQNKRK